MEQGNRTSLFYIIEFLTLAVLIAAVPSIVALDKEVFLSGSSEVSVTELTQEALVLLSAVMFGLGARQRPDSRGWLVLVAGFLTCMLIREADMWFDMLAKGFWVYPAVLTAGTAIAYATRHRGNLPSSMAAFAATRASAYIATGLLIVILFSRLFGSGSFWQQLVAGSYHPAYKTFIQEGIELLGYVLLAFGSVCFYLQHCRPRK